MKRLLLILLIVLLFPVQALSDDITLEWDANDDADYYVVYWGSSPGKYTKNSENIDVPKTQYTVTGLTNADWFFAVKAFNTCGNSSSFSDEVTSKVCKEVPETTNVIITLKVRVEVVNE